MLVSVHLKDQTPLLLFTDCFWQVKTLTIGSSGWWDYLQNHSQAGLELSHVAFARSTAGFTVGSVVRDLDRHRSYLIPAWTCLPLGPSSVGVLLRQVSTSGPQLGLQTTGLITRYMDECGSLQVPLRRLVPKYWVCPGQA